MRNSPILSILPQGFHWLNFSWQTINYGLSGLFMVVFWVFLAKMWPQAAFGQFSTVFVWVSIYSLVTDLGLDFWVTRQTALSGQKGYSSALVRLKLISSAFIALIFIGLAYINELPITVFLIFLLGTYLLNISHFFSCYLRGCEKLAVEAKISLIRNFVFMGCAVFGVLNGNQLIWVAWSYTLGSIVMGIMTFFSLRLSDFSLNAKRIMWRPLLITASSVWLTNLLAGLSVKTEILLLGLFLDDQAVAIYSAASRLFEGALLVATAFVLTLFPVLTKILSDKPGRYFVSVIDHGKLLLLICIVCSVVGFLVGEFFFTFFYSIDYRSSADLFKAMMFVFPISALICYLYNALLIAGKAKLVIAVLGIGWLLNVSFGALLIVNWGIFGALTGFIIKELLVCCSLGAILWYSSNAN